MNFKVLWFTILLGQIMAFNYRNCIDCSRDNSGRNFMCNFGGRLPTSDPYDMACCDPNDGHEYCQRSESNQCSPGSFNDLRHSFYTHCPRINATGCGIYGSDNSF